MSRPRVVIVGAGLGGSVLAHALCETHDVVVIERASDGVAVPPIRDVGHPAITDPHCSVGLGGSTKLWHNGLIEIHEDVFQQHWPMSKSELEPHYREAFRLLSKADLDTVRRATNELGDRYRSIGVPCEPYPGLYYPQWPLNMWEALKLGQRVTVVRGEVIDFLVDDNTQIRGVTVRTAAGTEQVTAETVVLAAGGLGTPCLLQILAKRTDLPALALAGCFYEDHPMGFVGEIEVSAPIYRLWNFRPKGDKGNLRHPLVLQRDGLHVSFQLRPAAAVSRSSRRERVGTVLNELRRRWWNPALWLGVLRHRDDVLDILSFKFGVHLPTPHFTLLLVAQMPCSSERSVWVDDQTHTAMIPICRRWVLTPAYFDLLQRCTEDLLALLEPITRSARLFDGWQKEVRSGAHHSGTARMSSSPQHGVCDVNAKVHGARNLYVCDGSLIPASGVSNTGLTIAALALRLAAHLKATAAPAVAGMKA